MGDHVPTVAQPHHPRVFATPVRSGVRRRECRACRGVGARRHPVEDRISVVADEAFGVRTYLCREIGYTPSQIMPCTQCSGVGEVEDNA
jgi:DnaJ-class molecular chaperone